MAKKRFRRSYKRGPLLKFKLKKNAVYTLVALSTTVAAGLILLSFSLKGPLLSRLNQSLLTFFGWTSFLLPPLLTLLALFFANFKLKIARPHVLAGSILILLSLTGLTQSGLLGQKLWATVFAFLPLTLGPLLVFTSLTLVGTIIVSNMSAVEALTATHAFVKKSLRFLKRYFFSDWLSLFKRIRRPQKPDFVISQPPASTEESRPLQIFTGKDDVSPQTPAVEAGRPPLPSPPHLLGHEFADALLNSPQDLGLWPYPEAEQLLTDGTNQKADRGDLKRNADIIEKTLESFGVTARIVEVNLGPAVTQYALEIPLGTKLSKITSLSNDLALALAAPTGQIRIEAPIPGRSLVGIEIPNRSPEVVTLKQILNSSAMKRHQSRLAFGLGLNVSGQPIIADLARMPHLLIAGQTGSGKSVCINSILCSLLFRNSPAELKLILVDPKRVELTLYHEIPHLLVPVIVDLEKILSALKWTLSEMDKRYKLFARSGVRNIEDFNLMAGFQALPYLVTVIDELADIIMFSPVEVEEAITRIAQMARATGLHLVVSTQRPSVNVLTGLIKANIPARIAFAVTSNIDSRVIIDQPGAEKLLGRGDMLFIPPDQSKPQRLQGTFVSDRDVKVLVRYLKSQTRPTYEEEVLTQPIKGSSPSLLKTPGADTELDELFDAALHIITQADKASASLLQRKLSIGYARAARLLDQLHAQGIVSKEDGSKPREVLIRDPNIFYLRQQHQPPQANDDTISS